MSKSTLVLLALVSVCSSSIPHKAKPLFGVETTSIDCQEGEYYDSFVEECFKCAQCSNFMYEIKSCTESSNAVCGWCGNIKNVKDMPDNVLISYQAKCLMSSLSFVDMSQLEYNDFNDSDEDEEINKGEVEKADIKNHSDSSDEFDYYRDDSDEDKPRHLDIEELLSSEIRSYFESKKKGEPASRSELKKTDKAKLLSLFPSLESSEEDDDAKFVESWVDDRIRRLEVKEKKTIEEEFMNMQRNGFENDEKYDEDDMCFECEKQKTTIMRIILILACALIFFIVLRRTCRPKGFKQVPLSYIDEKMLIESGKFAEKANKNAYDGPQIV